jgi:hypothetical protein
MFIHSAGKNSGKSAIISFTMTHMTVSLNCKVLLSMLFSTTTGKLTTQKNYQLGQVTYEAFEPKYLGLSTSDGRMGKQKF